MLHEIFGLILLIVWTLFLYGYVMRNNKMNNIKKCNIVNYPDTSMNIEKIDQTMSKEFDKKKFIHSDKEKAPMGYSEIEMLLPRVNVRYDSTEFNEYIF